MGGFYEEGHPMCQIKYVGPSTLTTTEMYYYYYGTKKLLVNFRLLVSTRKQVYL